MAALLKRLALTAGGRLVGKYQPPEGALFPCGHAVANAAPAHVKHLSPVPKPQKFQSDLDFLCRYVRPLEISELQRLSSGRHVKTTPKSFMLSFDDGLREAYDVIAPMLSKQGVPAIFFINSATIDNKRLMWRHKISLLIERSLERPKRIPPQLSLLPTENLQRKLRALSFSDEGLIDDIATFFEVDFDDYLRTAKPYLTADQVLALSRAGFEIGAHSDAHPYFQEIGVEDQKREVSTCVDFIRRLGLPCRYFAFPFHDEGMSLQLFDYLSAIGLNLSFGTSEARVDSVGFSYQRFSIEASDSSVPRVLSQLSAKSFLRRMNGTETIRRMRSDGANLS